ncbi:MAG: hypothetical protein INR71_01575 [Terriglobus roseus]|nr:hypothetical protein [Terriglobus roseus]
MSGQHHASPNAPFPQTLPTTSSASSAPAAHQRVMGTPMNHMSPYGAQQSARSGSGSGPTPDGAAVSALQTSLPPSQSQSATTPMSASKQTPTTPVTPELMAREQQRVTLLLTMNTELLWLATQLQNDGKAGPEGQQVPAKPDEPNGANAGKLAAKEYIECVSICRARKHALPC